jgi:predicted metal-dependent phosphoesterase TrpH
VTAGVLGDRVPGQGGVAGSVDLHSHSTASDGALAPAAVVETAHRAGLSALALTDHDSLAGIAEARDAGERLGIRVIAGVELSAFDAQGEIHLLALHVGRPDRLEQRLAVLREARVTRGEQIVARLNELGVRITFDDVLQQAGSGAVGRPHVAKALIAHGWARDSRDAFDRYLGAGRPANVEKMRLGVGDAIALIHDAGGIAVFAHPGESGRRARVEPLVQQGLDGLEVLHPSHSAEDVARIAALGEFFGLVPSGGSDWHGATEGPRTLGSQRVPPPWLARQDERVDAVRARTRVA